MGRIQNKAGIAARFEGKKNEDGEEGGAYPRPKPNGVMCKLLRSGRIGHHGVLESEEYQNAVSFLGLRVYCSKGDLSWWFCVK